ncbi:flagellar basal body P-ring formation chaperone FlgA [Helicobacter canadensis]|uniref:Flagellar basal body P-ring biosynthesis protein n=1 Tax=Helicobacter canadensis MIT 98-5491 TaxID=537970 RepID=C5ZXM3_9HELI|nr:flagellar basal body P-ring formation chaperone FlgA [Helicobacter canadensis]EES89891.1 flagellar basal body P-ring biosynthesis protein [Helicobacter canadensis MIT 98-5491]EFR49037.1 flagella basal body P-ring formation protein FlgA [Helicobacter canadensis MIT 98-5491]STP02609.1 flagellar basal body P-ring biosynthesis protein FlgA [Helicobacter canadensis]
MLQRILGIFLFFGITLYGLEYFVLEEEYSFSENKIYAKTLFPQLDHNFLLLEIPTNSSNFQIKSSQLIALFEKEGIQMGAKSSVVTFKKGIKGDIEGIKNYIAGLFLQEYKKNNIKIRSIELEQITPTDFNSNAIREIDFHSKLLKRKEGTFDVVIEENGRNKKVFFKYNLDATLEGMVTIDEISGGQTITYQNIRVVEIPFDKIGSELMRSDEIGKVAVRSYTPKEVLVTHDRLVAKRVVKKGDKIVVSVQEEGVVLEFVLEALKNGAIGDVIRAKALEGKKTYQVKVIDEGRGILQ